ncbi:MAG: DUF3861 domain-containing protein [Acidobacteriaceae bacterium]|nr:DUF3861 domain-containing protein [Acidobacteriaceae bacterium]
MYKYRVTLERIVKEGAKLPSGSPEDRLQFEADNHDDLFAIIARQRAKGLWSEDEATSLAVGLKLFGEVMLHNRKDPLFEPLSLPFREFIGRLKALPAKE